MVKGFTMFYGYTVKVTRGGLYMVHALNGKREVSVFASTGTYTRPELTLLGGSNAAGAVAAVWAYRLANPVTFPVKAKPTTALCAGALGLPYTSRLGKAA